MDQPLRCVFMASGEIHAQQVRAFLEAAGIPTAERGESLRNTHGLTIDGPGTVQISVTEADADRARLLLESAEEGAFRLADDAPTSPTDDANGGLPQEAGTNDVASEEPARPR